MTNLEIFYVDTCRSEILAFNEADKIELSTRLQAVYTQHIFQRVERIVISIVSY